MRKLIFIRKCLLCGCDTEGLGDICDTCKNQASIISGPVCSVCGIPLVSELETCLRCREQDFSFMRNISLFEYKGTAKDIFYQYKFAGNKIIARWYAQLLTGVIERNFSEPIVIPSPGSYMKKVRKGWDQVEQISSHLHKQCGCSVVHALKKKDGNDQKKLDLKGRRENLRNRITAHKRIGRLEGKDVLLLDDIFTTGATADECSRVLKEKGVRSIISLTIAID